MSNPFTNVHIQPAYAKNSAVVSWSVLPGYAGAEFYVFKSYNNGTPPWTLATTTPVFADSYVDTSLTVSKDPYYRVLMVHEGVEYDSPVVGAYDKMSKAQYGGISKMMGLEYRRMRSGNGIQVLHYIPLLTGDYTDNVDPDTEQQYGIPCPEDEDDLGLKFKGGYGPPIYTWLEISRFGEDKKEEAQNGLDISESLIHSAHLLAFPRPRPGHLFIHPPTDNRYVVTSVVQGNLFRGVFPISYDTNIQLLRRSDPRYRIIIPTPLPTPQWAKYE